jgi:hypothetical protein
LQLARVSPDAKLVGGEVAAALAAVEPCEEDPHAPSDSAVRIARALTGSRTREA